MQLCHVDGIILSGGGYKYQPSLFVTIKLLRLFGFSGPIEIWCILREIGSSSIGTWRSGICWGRIHGFPVFSRSRSAGNFWRSCVGCGMAGSTGNLRCGRTWEIGNGVSAGTLSETCARECGFSRTDARRPACVVVHWINGVRSGNRSRGKSVLLRRRKHQQAARRGRKSRLGCLRTDRLTPRQPRR